MVDVCEIGDVKNCTICKLCAVKCPTELDLEKVVVASRYLDVPRGSHRNVFQTMGIAMNRTEAPEWLKDDLDVGKDEDIAYFPGCLPIFDVLLERDSNYSGASYAGVKVMNKLGKSPQIIYGCCGHDLYYSGRLDEFEDTKKKMLEKIGDKKVVVGCAECFNMLKNVYGVDAQHFSDYVAENMDELEFKDLGIKATYHDPCRLGRYNDIYDNPRKLLEKVSNLKEMEHNKEDAICCGVSSWLNCNADTKKQREERLQEALDTGSEYMVVSCPKCRIHFDCVYHSESYEKDKPVDEIKVIDLQELVAQSLGLYDPDSKEKSYVLPEGGGETIARVVYEKDPSKYITDEVVENAFKCTTCFACVVTCPSDFETPHMMEKFREHLVEMDLNPPAHKKIRDNILKVGNPFGEESVVGEENDDYDVIYFPGCTAKYRFEDTMNATKRILDELGVKYTIPNDLVCCGSVLLRSGYKNDAKQVMNKNTEILKGKKVVVSCAGCYATFTRDYEGLDVTHLVDFLSDKIDKLDLKDVPKKVAYHDPCHFGREFQKFDVPREVIRKVPKTELVEFSKNRNECQCCGGGGGLRSHNKDLSLSLAEKKMEEAKDMGIDAIISTCPFCELNLSTVSDIKVYDVAEYILSSLEGNK